VLESRLRFLAGASPYQTSFVGDWVQRLIYYSAPPWVFTALYTAFALLVVVTFIAYPPRRNPGCKPGSNRAK
jgi:hypothetical protein